LRRGEKISGLCKEKTPPFLEKNNKNYMKFSCVSKLKERSEQEAKI
jgi:hypothetical protein